jgi:hypothetical protein
MPRFDSILFDNDFAVGVAIYSDHYQGYGNQNHIVISLSPGSDSSLSIRAILDTGAKWCIIDPDIANDWEDFFFNVYSSEMKYRIQGYDYEGDIAHANVVLNASNGQDLIIEARFFIPKLLPDQSWELPNFVGLDGLLNYMRFAIDPFENAIYFGKG